MGKIDRETLERLQDLHSDCMVLKELEFVYNNDALRQKLERMQLNLTGIIINVKVVK